MNNLNKQQREKTIMNIINTSYNIKCIYENMNSQNKEVLEKELKKQIKNENYLLDTLNIKEKNSQEIYIDFVNSLNESLLEDFKIDIKNNELKEDLNEYINLIKNERRYVNDLILKRFESYLIMKFRYQPKKSTSSNIVKRLQEDRATIHHEALLDYNTSIIRFLNELSETADSLSITDKAINQKNRLLFTDKQLEERYLNQNYIVDGYEKCLENGHELEVVDYIYNDVLATHINEQATRCYIYPDSILNDKEEASKFAIDLQILKSGIYLLKKKEIKEILSQYKTHSNNTKISTKMITSSIEDVLEQKKKERKMILSLKKVDLA